VAGIASVARLAGGRTVRFLQGAPTVVTVTRVGLKMGTSSDTVNASPKQSVGVSCTAKGYLLQDACKYRNAAVLIRNPGPTLRNLCINCSDCCCTVHA
jgi:hypothetical protein